MIRPYLNSRIVSTHIPLAHFTPPHLLNANHYMRQRSGNVSVNRHFVPLNFNRNKSPSNNFYSLKERILTIPNILSISRIALAPFAGLLVLNDKTTMSLFLLGICGLTDILDGYLARRWRQESALGSILDPIGDKVLAVSLASTMAWKGFIPLPLTLLILTRDALLVICSIFVRWKSVRHIPMFKEIPYPSFWDKFKIFMRIDLSTPQIFPTFISKTNTAMQITLFCISLLAVNLSPQNVDGTPPSLLHDLWPLQWIVGCTTVASGISYAHNYRSVIKLL